MLRHEAVDRLLQFLIAQIAESAEVTRLADVRAPAALHLDLLVRIEPLLAVAA